MKKITLNKVGIALSLLLLSTLSYSSAEENKIDEFMLSFTLSQCSEYVISTQSPDKTLNEKITDYLNYLRIDTNDIPMISKEIIKLKDTHPQLGLVLFNENDDRDMTVSFCAIAASHYVESLKNKLGLAK
ncbi:TPA: hypothetical protein ACS8CD_003537 [Providencia alcalifaciens]|uniref:Uncharacterized protein n=1 Tax=Providencia alcalifaciens TaxID=126385 RepID=A0AAW9VFJ4_9GAMM|nr:hypothetical protein [Providencia alcalifaciens]